MYIYVCTIRAWNLVVKTRWPLNAGAVNGRLNLLYALHVRQWSKPKPKCKARVLSASMPQADVTVLSCMVYAVRAYHALMSRSL